MYVYVCLYICMQSILGRVFKRLILQWPLGKKALGLEGRRLYKRFELLNFVTHVNKI